VASADPLGPSTPTLTVSAGPGAGTISLSWTASSSLTGVTQYNIYRGPAGNETPYATVNGTTTTFVDSGLGNGVTWCYKVSATDILGTSGLSNEGCATTASVPSAPQNVAAQPGPGLLGDATVTWAAPASNGGLAITGYTVYRDGTAIGTTGASTLTFTDHGLTPLHAYSYTVSASNSAGEGPQSAAACSDGSPWITGTGILPDCITVL